jgi:hypothetical protein
MGHRIIPVRCTWAEFEKLKGKKFRNEFKSIERKLNQAGSWRILCIENGNKGSDAIKKILDVERMSWKEGWRSQLGIEIDPDLIMMWEGSQYMVKTEPDFKLSVWLLELNGQTLAYVLFPQYKEVAYLAKTSYDERYKKFYPGIYVINAAIRELFNKRQARHIDFLTDLAFMETWTSICLPRVRVMISQKGILPIIIRFTVANAYIKNILRIILGPLKKRARVAFNQLFMLK